MAFRASRLTTLFGCCCGKSTLLMRDDDYGPPLKPEQVTTHGGCKCKERCGTNVADDYGKCDWCYTLDGCGIWGVLGHWDTCEYSPMEEFDKQPYSDKTAQLWARITDPDVVDQSGPAHLSVKTLHDMVSISMITTFDNEWEVMPAEREKVIHGQGVLCQFDLVVHQESRFTGVLSPGTQTGLIRFGSATSLDNPITGDIFPGIGIKFLRSGVHSAGWVALRTAGPDGNYNFFDSAFSNHVAPPDLLVKLDKFQQASGCITMVGLSDACSYTQAGEKVGSPVFPFEIMFEPTGAINFEDKTKSNDELLNELAGIPDGTKVLEVRTFASPMDKVQGNTVTIGTLTTKGTCHRSLFGDLELFFRHQRMEEDFALAPDWIQQMDALDDPVCVASPGPVSQWQCPVMTADSTIRDRSIPQSDIITPADSTIRDRSIPQRDIITPQSLDPTPQEPSSVTVDPSTPELTTAPAHPTTEGPRIPPADPTTQKPTIAPEEITTQEPTAAPTEPTTEEPTTVAPVDPTTPEPTIAPAPTTQEPMTASVDPTTQEPTILPVEPTTIGPARPTLSPKHCRTCSTSCAPCKECMEGPGGSFALGSCEKCWHCWDWDDDELEDDDADMDKDCDALHKDHDWDDDEVRCLTDAREDCRACWAELGEMTVFV